MIFLYFFSMLGSTVHNGSEMRCELLEWATDTTDCSTSADLGRRRRGCISSETYRSHKPPECRTRDYQRGSSRSGSQPASPGSVASGVLHEQEFISLVGDVDTAEADCFLLCCLRLAYK